MTTPSYHAAHQARQLAALSTLDGVRLPDDFLHAVGVYQEAMAIEAPALPEPGAVGRATANAALDLVCRALAAKAPGNLPPLDTGPIVHAREADQDALDQAALIEQVRAASAALLAKAASDHLDQIVKALQDRHAQVMGELTEHARQLPEGVDDQQALELGEPTRTHYLACRDLATAAGQLREALAEVDPPTAVPDALEFTLGYERSGGLYQAWLPRAATSRYGDPGTLPFWLAAAHDPGLEFWLPTPAQVQARATQIRQQHQAQRVAQAQAHGVVMR